MILTAAVVTTPFGPVCLIADGGTLVAAGFTATPESLLRHTGNDAARPALGNSLGDISERVTDYLDGDVVAIDDIIVRARGSQTMQQIWRRLRAVPPGTTVSYAELGGHPRMARVAAMACARNPIALIVPCHRVVRSDGGLGGFGGGLPAKRWLLEHEARWRAHTAAGSPA